MGWIEDQSVQPADFQKKSEVAADSLAGNQYVVRAIVLLSPSL